MTRPSREIPPCLACRQTPDHHERCRSTDKEATYYLRQPIPGGHRDWAPTGIRYTGTPGRRKAVRGLMPKTRWVRMHGTPELPMSPGLLINEILAGFGSSSRKTARVGYNPVDFLTTLDCSCDPWRCVHDYDTESGTPPDWITAPRVDPDMLFNMTLVAVQLRWADMWQTFWFADVGAAAVCLAVDEVPEISPPGISMACHRRWCDLCPGSTKPREGTTARESCSCPHHMAATS